MKRWIGAASIGLGLALAAPAEARVDVFACEAHWAAVAQAVGGPRVAVTQAVPPDADPTAPPGGDGLVDAAAGAELLLCTGAGLESAWLDGLLASAGNAAVTEGGRGRLMAAEVAKLLEDVPPEHALAEGEGHAHAHADIPDNPHVHGDPRNVQRVAGHVARRLIQLDPEHEAGYGERAKALISKLGEAIGELKAEAAALDGVAVVVRSSNSLYLLRWLGLRTVAQIEPEAGTLRPGEAAARGRSLGARLVVQAAYEEPGPAREVAERLAVPLVVLPYTVAGTAGAGDLVTLYSSSVRRLLDGLELSEGS